MVVAAGGVPPDGWTVAVVTRVAGVVGIDLGELAGEGR